MSTVDRTGNDQISRVVDFARVQIERYIAYHAHKESMAYTGLALFAGAAGAILIADKWPPAAWGHYRTLIAILALTAFWVIILIYLRFQLHRRRWAALRVAGCERLLAKWATGELIKENRLKAERRPHIDPAPLYLTVLDWVWPHKCSVRAVAMPKVPFKEPPVYPGVLLEEWVRQENRGTDAHERLIIVVGWGVYISLVFRTLCAIG